MTFKNKKANMYIRSAIDFVTRYSIIFAIGFLALYIITPIIQELNTIRLIFLFESIALILSSIGIYLITNAKYLKNGVSVKSIKEVCYGEDGKLSAYELQAYMRIIGTIFLAIHIFVGLSVLSIYITQFSSPM